MFDCLWVFELFFGFKLLQSPNISLLKKCKYLNFCKVQIFEQDGKKGGKRKWDKSDKWDKARCQQCCAGVQDKDSTHTHILR